MLGRLRIALLMACACSASEPISDANVDAAFQVDVGDADIVDADPADAGADAASDAGQDAGDTGSDAGDAGYQVDPSSLRARLSPELEHVGAAINVAALRADGTYAAIAGREFDRVTPENAMKWGSVQPEPSTFDFTDADALVSFAEAHAQQVRGHTLVWHNQLPAWVNDAMTAPELQAALDAFIDAMMTRWQGRTTTWDVVNEAIDDRGGMRDTIFLEKLGPGYVAEAFARARAADPQAELAYNDYDIEWRGPKQDGVVALLEQLLAQGAPIDAVGMQFHLTGYDFASFDITEQKLSDSIRRFAALGLAVHLTEVDLRIANLPGDASARLDYQANVYQRIVDLCRREDACRSVTFWGFADAYSWVDAQFGPDDPLLYDDQLAAKPAYPAVRSAFEGEGGPGFDFGLDTACGTSLLSSALCLPFEALDAGRAYVASRAGSISFSTVDPYRGARSLLVETVAGANPQALIGRSVLPAVSSGTIHARTYVKVPAGPLPDSLTLLSIGEADPPYLGATAGLFQGNLQLGLTTVNQFPTSNVALPRDSWRCLELVVDVGDAGSARLYLDGVETVSLTAVDTSPPTGISNANFGVLYVNPPAMPVQVWFDESAVGTSPLPCD